MKSSLARIPVKLHKNVTLVRTTEPVLAEELLARKSLARWVVGRLSDTVLLVQHGEVGAGDRRASPAGPHAAHRRSGGLTEMPQGSQSPTSPRRMSALGRHRSLPPAMSRAMPFAPRSGRYKGTLLARDPAGAGCSARRPADSPQRQCRRDHRAPGSPGGRTGARRPLAPRIAPCAGTVRPHRSDLVFSCRAFAGAAKSWKPSRCRRS